MPPEDKPGPVPPRPPRWLGKSRTLQLTGKIFPWDPETQQPVLLGMPGTNAKYLPLFSSPEALRKVMAHIEVEGFTMKQVQEGFEFLDSIPGTWGDVPLHIAVDPYLTETGTVRWSQLSRD